MCRIVGLWDQRPEPGYDLAKVVDRMKDVMSYGGPDDEGSYVDRQHGLALGHRRLSILDLSATGHQPMQDRERDVWTVYNGEIYNFREVRAVLEGSGHRFTSTSDTEVLLQAYRQWGMEMLSRFRGMFAFALWDRPRQTLILARDRAGVKPLYWSFRDGVLVFASELKAFHQFPGFRKELNPEALWFFLQLGYIPGPRSIFRDVWRLEPGSWLELDRRGTVRISRYWDVRECYARRTAVLDEQEAEERLEALLVESFRLRLVSDVPVGVFLSGGVDSSAVTALLQRHADRPLKTFTIGFAHKDYDESEHAKKVALHLGTDHTELVCTLEDAFEVLESFEEIYDEPFGDSSGIPTFLVSRLARREVKVALSADAGDELFAGYTKYGFVRDYHRRLARLPGAVRGLASGLLGLLSPEAVEALWNGLTAVLPLPRYSNLKDKFFKFRNMLSERDLCSSYMRAGSFATPRTVAGILARPPEPTPGLQGTGFDLQLDGPLDVLSCLQIMDFTTYMVDDILVKVDRATMQNSLEGREPFLDHHLIEFVAGLQPKLKLRDGVSKWLLRKVLYKHVPRELIERPKMGFQIPLYPWMRGSILTRHADLFAPGFLKAQGIFEESAVSSLVKGFTSGRPVNANFIWFLFVFQRWFRRWM
jgi:asparagine synthase (glutamine-hydrolysing)